MAILIELQSYARDCGLRIEYASKAFEFPPNPKVSNLHSLCLHIKYPPMIQHLFTQKPILPIHTNRTKVYLTPLIYLSLTRPDTSSSTFQVKGLRLNPKGTAVIVGNVASNWEPVRNKQSKYYISENQVIQEGSLSSYE